jgi:hypothetical protein
MIIDVRFVFMDTSVRVHNNEVVCFYGVLSRILLNAAGSSCSNCSAGKYSTQTGGVAHKEQSM